MTWLDIAFIAGVSFIAGCAATFFYFTKTGRKQSGRTPTGV